MPHEKVDHLERLVDLQRRREADGALALDVVSLEVERPQRGVGGEGLESSGNAAAEALAAAPISRPRSDSLTEGALSDAEQTATLRLCEWLDVRSRHLLVAPTVGGEVEERERLQRA